MSLWQNPLQSPQGTDYRNLKGYIYIASEQTLQFFGQDRIGSLGDIENKGGVFLHCYESESTIPIRLGNVPGIFYHGPRQKWIVWEGSSVSSTRVVDKETGEVKDTKNGPNTLGLRFDPTQLCVLNPDQLICSKVIVFEDGNACIPWPEEYIDLIDFKKIKQCTSEYSKSDGSVRGVIPLLGDIEYKYQITSSGIVFVDGTVKLWPFLPHWKSYWLRLSVRENERAVSKNWVVKPYKSIKNSEQNRHAGYLISKPKFINKNTYFNKFESTQVISEWPDCVFLYKKNTSHVGGLLIVPSLPQENYLEGQRSGQTSRIALDFGTFRSVIAVYDPGIKESFQFMLDNNATKGNDFNFINHAKVPGFASLDCIIASNGQKDIERWHISCPEYKATSSNINNKGIKFLTTFSKIMFTINETEDPSSQNILMSERIPFLDFTLPIHFDQESASQSQNASKWNLFSKDNAIIPFIKALFLMAMVEQQRQSPGENASYNISYPLAFSDKQREFLINVCYEAAQWVNQCLPEEVTLRGANNGYPMAYSESQAIYQAAGANNNLKNKIIGVADIGGGTLDISVWKIEKGKNSGEPIIIDSVQIGAEFVFAKYCSLFKVSDEKKLRWSLINDGYEKLSEKDKNTPEYLQQFIPAVNQWFDAQIEYIARTFGCTIPKNNLNYEVVLVLAGGGWKIVELFEWNIKTLKEKIHQKLQKQLQKIDIKILNIEILTDLYKNGFEKIAVAGGLLEIGDNQMAINEIRSPNGLEEEAESGVISWSTMIHEQDPWPGLKIIQSNNQVRPDLHFISSIENDALRRVQGRLKNEIKDQKRTKTALATLLEQYFSLREENK
jgi:hypothetical protein